MKARRSTVSAFLRSAIVLTTLIPIGSLHRPVARARSVAPSATVPDSSHISDAPDAAPLMFIENVGQFNPGSHQNGTDGLQWQPVSLFVYSDGGFRQVDLG